MLNQSQKTNPNVLEMTGYKMEPLCQLADKIGTFGTWENRKRMAGLDDVILYGSKEEQAEALSRLEDICTATSQLINHRPTGTSDDYTVDLAAAKLLLFALTGNVQHLWRALGGIQTSLDLAQKQGQTCIEKVEAGPLYEFAEIFDDLS